MTERSTEEPRGTTLKVYRYIVASRKAVRISDIQADLRLSSPSLAHYHVKKLLELGMVREEGSGYTVDKLIIQNFFLIRGLLVPFQAAYTSFFCATLISMITILVTVNHSIITSFVFVALGANVAALFVSAYELRRTLRGIP